MPSTITLLGVPWDGSSSFQRGAAGGPAAIRAAIASPSSNTWNEEVVDLAPLLEDAGDLPLATLEDPVGAREIVEAKATALFSRGARPIFLGGDHSISWPLVRAAGRHHPGLTVLHVDAHPDLYDNFEGDRGSHACPFARVMEEGAAERLVQVGIRCMTRHQLEQATRFGVVSVPMKAGFSAMRDAVTGLVGPLYLSLDLDALDPAFAPGLSHPEPGGLTTRELLSLIQAIPAGALIGGDVVELNPTNDVRDLTARVAARCVKEIAGRL